MKKLYILLIIIVFGQGVAFAQNAATPNPGFENWTQVGNRWDPDDWNTLNPNTGIIGILTCTRATGADVHSGTYAIKLTTKSVFGVTANGIAYNEGKIADVHKLGLRCHIRDTPTQTSNTTI